MDWLLGWIDYCLFFDRNFVKMSKAKRGKSGNASDTGNWETELVQVAFVEVNFCYY